MSRSIGFLPTSKQALRYKCRINATATVQMLHATSGDALAERHGSGICLQDCGIPFLHNPTVSAGSDGISRKKAVVVAMPPTSANFSWTQVYE
jgi:hypothetical protein